jgi:hypothetical protein
MMNKLSCISSFLALAMGCVSTQTIATAMPVRLDPTTDHAHLFKSTHNPNNRLVNILKYVRPKTADNGSPFPKQSGYIKDYPIQFKNGLSSVTVDNSKNSSDIFMKLYTLNSTPPQAIRVFFIRKGEKFTTKNVKAGSYDLRFRDLNYGGLSRTDGFDLEEYKEFDGSTKFHKFTLTLKSPRGNIKMHPLSEQEF